MKIIPILAAFAIVVLTPASRAQIAISSITTTTTDLPNTTNDTPGVTFENTKIALNTFTTATGSNYAVSSLANQAFVRRSTGIDNPNQSSVWYRDGAAPNELGTYATNYATLMLDNNIAGGSDNTFANGTQGAHVAQDGNIERLDFVYNGGLIASSALVFAVFERGAVGVHDLFKIAVITGWDAINNVPTAYSTLTGPSSSADWGTNNVVADFGYHLFRYNTGDNLTTSTAHTETGTQGLGGIAFSMAQLGITPGTKIYGYSLFGNDVTGAGSQLIDYTNSTFYPTATSNSTGTGGIDLATINGVSFTVVPEPSTYALGGVGVMVAAVLWHHRRRRALAPARS